jgi:hypothetical protein
MNLRIQGSSIRKEFVYCYNCRREFVWLNAYPYTKQSYIAVCAKCKKMKLKVKVNHD